jgi:hypothetical protein
VLGVVYNSIIKEVGRDLERHYPMLGVVYNRHYYREVGRDLERHYRMQGVVYNRHYYREVGRDLEWDYHKYAKSGL